MKKNVIKYISMMLVCMVLGILIALQMKSVTSREFTTKNVQSLQQQVLDYQKKNELLSSRNEELSLYVDQLEKNANKGGETSQAIKQELEAAQSFAGLLKETGDGIVIKITPTGNTSVRDSVLRLFVNELCSLGSSAISINDQRKVAMTEIRATGSTIVINGEAFSRQEPFTIKALLPLEKQEYNLNYLDKVKALVLEEYQGEPQRIEVYNQEKLEIVALSAQSNTFQKLQ